MSWRDELSENVWVEGTLRLEYGKAGIYNSNRLPAEKKEKKKEKKEKIPGIGRYPMGPTNPAPIDEEKCILNLLATGQRYIREKATRQKQFFIFNLR